MNGIKLILREKSPLLGRKCVLTFSFLFLFFSYIFLCLFRGGGEQLHGKKVVLFWNGDYLYDEIGMENEVVAYEENEKDEKNKIHRVYINKKRGFSYTKNYPRLYNYRGDDERFGGPHESGTGSIGRSKL